MPRLSIMILVAAVGLSLMPPQAGAAGPRSAGLSMGAPGVGAAAPGPSRIALPRGAMPRHQIGRRDLQRLHARDDRGRRFHILHGRRFFGAPSFYPHGYGSETVILRDLAREPDKFVDRNSFAHLPVRMGIPYPPMPRPVIYRIEGTKQRPVARIIRIGEEETRPRGRLARAEEGARILTVDPR